MNPKSKCLEILCAWSWMSNLTLVKILAKSVYPFWNNSSFWKCSLTFWREFIYIYIYISTYISLYISVSLSLSLYIYIYNLSIYISLSIYLSLYIYIYLSLSFCVSILSLLDLSAAFDTIDHNILITRLRSTFGCSDIVLEWFISYLSCRTQSVFVGHESTPSVLKCGVPQGSVLGPLLFTLYTHPLSTVICQSGISYHFFADDSQLHNSNVPSDFPVLACCLKDCIEDVADWMADSKLKMNDDKTELMAIGTRSKLSQVIPNLVPMSISGCDIPFSQSVRNLGFYLDETLSMDAHINKLQRIQNHAARLVLRKSKHESATTLLRTLHWLPVKARIQYKIACLCFQCIYQNSMPPYISDLLHPYCPSRTLRSLDASLLTVPRFSLETFGKKSFSVFGPTVWNSLPLSLRKSQCFTTFKAKLKTHLFRTHLCWSASVSFCVYPCFGVCVCVCVFCLNTLHKSDGKLVLWVFHYARASTAVYVWNVTCLAL